MAPGCIVGFMAVSWTPVSCRFHGGFIAVSWRRFHGPGFIPSKRIFCHIYIYIYGSRCNPYPCFCNMHKNELAISVCVTNTFWWVCVYICNLRDRGLAPELAPTGLELKSTENPKEIIAFQQHHARNDSFSLSFLTFFIPKCWNDSFSLSFLIFLTPNCRNDSFSLSFL